jgi:hypothetical protein
MNSKLQHCSQINAWPGREGYNDKRGREQRQDHRGERGTAGLDQVAIFGLTLKGR